MLSSIADDKVYSLVHLIYRSKHYEGHSKDYEFSRLSMEEHWRAGYHDAMRTLRHPEALQRPAIRTASPRSTSPWTGGNSATNQFPDQEHSPCTKTPSAPEPSPCL